MLTLFSAPPSSSRRSTSCCATRRGLVDFPSIRDGEEIYLCWKLDEQRVAWWHEPDAGFAGRQPL